LLDVVQAGVPLLREPYAQIARRLGCDEQTVLERLAAMRGQNETIREISGIFDAAAFGYEQVLAALAVPEGSLDKAGHMVAAHPGVSHCYGREGRYNLWFTLATSARSELGVERTAGILARRAGAACHLVLPALRRYKLDVRFGVRQPATVTDSPEAPEPPVGASGDRLKLTDEQVRAVKVLQTDLPNRQDPFAPLAVSVGIDPDTLLVHAADMLAGGLMRRYAATVYHRRVGAEANVLVAWLLGSVQADRAALSCARHRAVSHCYLRASAADWPYQLYTMIHGRDRAACRQTISELAAVTGLSERAELWTRQEYKKRRIALFSDEEAAWESAAGRGG